MRKRTFNHIIDKVFWYIIYLLPLIVFIICLLNSKNVTGGSEFEYVQTLDVDTAIVQTWEVLLPFNSDNLVSQSIETLSDHFGLINLLGRDSFLNSFFSYYVYVIIFHLVIDILLFIPKLAHKWIGGFINEE